MPPEPVPCICNSSNGVGLVSLLPWLQAAHAVHMSLLPAPVTRCRAHLTAKARSHAAALYQAHSHACSIKRRTTLFRTCSQTPDHEQLSPPEPRTGAQESCYHHDTRFDEYHWMHDLKTNRKELLAHLKAENRCEQRYECLRAPRMQVYVYLYRCPIA